MVVEYSGKEANIKYTNAKQKGEYIGYANSYPAHRTYYYYLNGKYWAFLVAKNGRAVLAWEGVTDMASIKMEYPKPKPIPPADKIYRVTKGLEFNPYELFTSPEFTSLKEALRWVYAKCKSKRTAEGQAQYYRISKGGREVGGYTHRNYRDGYVLQTYSQIVGQYPNDFHVQGYSVRADGSKTKLD